jgi:hypothetical protein
MVRRYVREASVFTDIVIRRATQRVSLVGDVDVSARKFV